MKDSSWMPEGFEEVINNHTFLVYVRKLRGEQTGKLWYTCDVEIGIDEALGAPVFPTREEAVDHALGQMRALVRDAEEAMAAMEAKRAGGSI